MGLFKPAYNSKFYFRRKKWIHKNNPYTPENQKIIIEMAKTDEWPEVRLEAMKHIANQEDVAWIAIHDEMNGLYALNMLVNELLIAKIALETKNDSIRWEAIEMISDQEVLVYILKSAREADMRKLVIKKINNPSLVEQVLNDEKEKNIKRKAAEKEKKLSELIKVVLQGKQDASLNAFKQIADQISHQQLLEIINSVPHEEVLLLAIKQMDDQTILENIKKNGTTFMVRQTARTKLNRELDQNDWADRAQYVKGSMERKHAIWQLNADAWQDLFVKMIEPESDMEILNALVARLDPKLWQDLLTNIATNLKYADFVRCQAISKLSNTEIIEKIAKTDANITVRKAAYEKMGNTENEEVLFDLAKNSPRLDDCMNAVEKLNNQQLLAEIVLQSDKNDVRLKALAKISDETLLEPITNISVKYEKELEIRLKAIEKISNEDILVRIAINQAYEKSGLKAVQKILSTDRIFEVAKASKYQYLNDYTEHQLINSFNPEILEYLTKYAVNFSIKYKAYSKLNRENDPKALFLKSCLESSKTCERCHKPVPMTSEAGGNCPHCGVYWDKLNERFV